MEGQEKTCAQGGKGWEVRQELQRGHCRDGFLAVELALGGPRKIAKALGVRRQSMTDSSIKK